MKREVKEEAGLEMEPVTLISVEFGSGSWMRFNFTGKIIGNVNFLNFLESVILSVNG